MRALLEESLEQGAWGYSTGLEYAAERAASRDELGSPARSAPDQEACTRHTRATATPARRPPSTRRSRRPSGPARACRSRTSSLATGRGDPRLRSSRRARRHARARRRFRHAHTSLRHDVSLDRRSARVPARRPARHRRGATRGGRGDGVVHEHPERRRRLVAHRPSRQPALARVRPSRYRLDRGRPASDGAEAICDLLAASPEALGTLMVIIHCYTRTSRRRPSSTRSARSAPMRRRWRPTARSRRPSSTARTRGRRGTSASWFASGLCSRSRRPSSG